MDSKPQKIHKTLRLDPVIIAHFEKEAEKTGHSVNALINAALLKIARLKK